MAKIGRALQKDCPRTQPQPEFLLLVRVQRQVVGLRAVALEESRQRLPGVHDAEKSGVVD